MFFLICYKYSMLESCLIKRPSTQADGLYGNKRIPVFYIPELPSGASTSLFATPRQDFTVVLYADHAFLRAVLKVFQVPLKASLAALTAALRVAGSVCAHAAACLAAGIHRRYDGLERGADRGVAGSGSGRHAGGVYCRLRFHRACAACGKRRTDHGCGDENAGCHGKE